jgi:predicted nucleic acid-binding protein
MFVLDTNILSAMMSTQAVPQVAAWIAGQPADLLFTTSVNQAEILSGLAIMAEGRRRLDLEAAARAMLLDTAPRRSATESLISTQS